MIRTTGKIVFAGTAWQSQPFNYVATDHSFSYHNPTPVEVKGLRSFFQGEIATLRPQ